MLAQVCPVVTRSILHSTIGVVQRCS
jgi:hypothetical protein